MIPGPTGSYATEDREAGTRALGGGEPGLAREQLSVFTPAEWEARKGRLILEAWLARVPSD